MANLGGSTDEFFDLENLPEKAPVAAGGCLAVIGGFMAFVGFFLAWAGGLGTSVSGFDLAKDFDYTVYYCIPCLGILILLVGFALAGVAFLRREVPYVKPIAAGLLAVLSVFLLCPIFYEREGVKFGWWCAPLGAVLIVSGAVIALVLPPILKENLP